MLCQFLSCYLLEGGLLDSHIRLLGKGGLSRLRFVPLQCLVGRDSLHATVFSYCIAYQSFVEMIRNDTDDFLFALYIYIKRPVCPHLLILGHSFLYQMIESNVGNFFANSQSSKINLSG